MNVKLRQYSLYSTTKLLYKNIQKLQNMDVEKSRKIEALAFSLRRKGLATSMDEAIDKAEGIIEKNDSVVTNEMAQVQHFFDDHLNNHTAVQPAISPSLAIAESSSDTVKEVEQLLAEIDREIIDEDKKHSPSIAEDKPVGGTDASADFHALDEYFVEEQQEPKDSTPTNLDQNQPKLG